MDMEINWLRERQPNILAGRSVGVHWRPVKSASLERCDRKTCQRKAAARKQRCLTNAGFKISLLSTAKAPKSSDIMVMYPVWHIIVDELPRTKISGFYIRLKMPWLSPCVNEFTV